MGLNENFSWVEMVNTVMLDSQNGNENPGCFRVNFGLKKLSSKIVVKDNDDFENVSKDDDDDFFFFVTSHV